MDKKASEANVDKNILDMTKTGFCEDYYSLLDTECGVGSSGDHHVLFK